MKNRYRLMFLFLLGFTLFNVSCDNHEEEDYSLSDTPEYSVALSSSTVDEGQSVTVTLTSDYIPNEPVSLRLSIVGGDAVDTEDFDVTGLTRSDIEWGDPEGKTFEVQIPAFSTSFSFNIVTYIDTPNDDDETVSFQLSKAGFRNATVDSTGDFTITINNVKSDVVTFVGGWDQSFDFGGSTYTLCDVGYDMDFLYADDTFTIQDYFGSYDQCPETAEVSISEWGDGTWHVFNTVYDNAGLSSAGITPPFDIPVTVEYSRAGSTLAGSYTQDAANTYNSDAPSDPSVSDYRYCYSFTIDTATNTVTVFDYTTSTTLGSGKMSKPQLKGLDKLQRRVK